MYALISPNEDALKYDGTRLGERVCEVAENVFEIAPPLLWVEYNGGNPPEDLFFDGVAIGVKPRDPKAPIVGLAMP